MATTMPDTEIRRLMKSLMGRYDLIRAVRALQREAEGDNPNLAACRAKAAELMDTVTAGMDQDMVDSMLDQIDQDLTAEHGPSLVDQILAKGNCETCDGTGQVDLDASDESDLDPCFDCEGTGHYSEFE